MSAAILEDGKKYALVFETAKDDGNGSAEAAPVPEKSSAKLQDSGERRRFESGAVRDIAAGKGRCDLLPLWEVALILGGGDNIDPVLCRIAEYVNTGSPESLQTAVTEFARRRFDMPTDKDPENQRSIYTAMLEAAKQYEDGCEKYGERNWEKGIPLHCYIDSGVRHYLKFLRGDDDERHDRAFIWNMLGALWTQRNKPRLVDLPFTTVQATNKNGDVLCEFKRY